MAQRDVEFAASSNIKSLAYDNETQELTCVFAHGGTYVYSGVPANVVDGFASAPSAGQYLHQFVKPLYQYEKA
jgi:hypothetical protein